MKIKLAQNDIFLKEAFTAAMIPSILSTLSGCLNILADGVLVGHRIGVNGLAAINVCVPLYLLQCVVGSFVVSGAGINCSKEIGKRETDRARMFYLSAISIGTLAALVLTILGVGTVDALATVLSRDAQVRVMVRDYAFITFLGTLPKVLIYIPFWFLRIDGKNKSVTAMMFLMGVGNIVLDIVFLYFFDWGILGAALASVISTFAACIYGFLVLCKNNEMFHLEWRLPDKEVFGEIATAGSPSAVNNLFQTIRLLCINALLLKYGGNYLVAMFTIVNGVAAFAEAVTLGIPQSGLAILGICYGERDNPSIRILLKRELKSGLIGCIIFGIGIIVGADLIAFAYGVDMDLKLPMCCLAVSLIPALCNNILTNFYNATGKEWLTNILIFSKVLLFSIGSLYFFCIWSWTPWWFLVASEILTLVLWIGIAVMYSGKQKEISPYLLLNQKLEHSGKVINFSISSNDAEICDASEKIVAFCEENEMETKQIMRVSLALEEIMTLISNVNIDTKVSFDIRVFSVQDTIGIRFRYDGKAYNPLDSVEKEDDMYMGLMMLKKLVEDVVYQTVFGRNTLIILL